MGMADLRGRRGGVAAVVAAFWLGFVCGGGSLPGAAVIGGASGQPPQEPASASQSPQGPAPASQPPQEPAPASQSPQEPPPAPEESGPAPQTPEGPAPAPVEPAPADSVPEEESTQADAVPAESTQADAVPAESTQADTVPEESTQADAVAEESTEPDAETDAAPVPEPPLVQERPREFTARTGMVLYFVNAGGETAYEETMARVAEALAASESEERRQQADGWSTYKAEEPLADGGRLYVSWLDPVVPGVDYWVPGILNEAFPTEAQTLYETYAGAFADGQILLNLVPIPGP